MRRVTRRVVWRTLQIAIGLLLVVYLLRSGQLDARALAGALLGTELPWRAVAAVVPLIHLAAGVPITPFGNAGVLEATYGEVLAQVGIGEGALLGLLQRSVSWSWALVGAGTFALRRFGADPDRGRTACRHPPSTPPAGSEPAL